MLRVLALIALAGCVPTDPDVGSPRDVDADTDADADSDADPDTDLDEDTDPEVDVCAQPPSCVVGHGNTGFAAVDTTSQIVLVHGPQGGWHVDLAVQTQSTTQVVRVLPVVRHLPTGSLLAGDDGLFDTFNLALSSTGECSGEAWQLTTYLDEVLELDLEMVCGLAGGALAIDLTVTTEDQRVATCSATGIAALDPADVGPCGSAP